MVPKNGHIHFCGHVHRFGDELFCSNVKSHSLYCCKGLETYNSEQRAGNPVWLNKFYQFQPLPTRVAKPRKETPYMYSLYSYHGFAIFHDERYVKTGSRSACFIQNPNPLVTLPPLRVPLLWRADFRNLEAALRTMLWRLVRNLARETPNLGSGMLCFQEGNHPVPI